MWNMQGVSNSISNMAFEKQEGKRDTKEAHKSKKLQCTKEKTLIFVLIQILHHGPFASWI